MAAISAPMLPPAPAAPSAPSVPVPAAKETVQPGPSPATPSDPASPPDKAEMERKAREAATMMVEAVQKNDPELMKKYIIDFWERRAGDSANPLKMWASYYRDVQHVMKNFKCVLGLRP